MNDFKFPDPPEPKDLPWYRRLPPMYYWWGGTVLFLGVAIIWLPSQCVLNDLEVPERGNPEENAYNNLNQEKDLEFREDGLWYEIKSESPFTGFADAYHPNGQIRSRTKVKDGLAYGLIQEWDENGTLLGTLFKDEFQR
ncbi:MAG TPA: hypothetical protein DHU78_01660 [Opitutae bacterium]|nr:hypothetical protein [Puniceicoccaceae bacterium]HAU59740.1 hypothetical protein [Opitutae bacterium]HCY57548.1 hypothetical protein [Opitutae bacterium]